MASSNPEMPVEGSNALTREGGPDPHVVRGIAGLGFLLGRVILWTNDPKLMVLFAERIVCI